MSNTEDLKSQLDTLRGNTETTGILHEAQIKNMQYWALGLVPESTEVSIEFNHKQYLIYKITAKSLKFKQKKKRLAMISEWTKELLGDRYLVEIYINNSPIFNSDIHDAGTDK